MFCWRKFLRLFLRWRGRDFDDFKEALEGERFAEAKQILESYDGDSLYKDIWRNRTRDLVIKWEAKNLKRTGLIDWDEG